LGLPELPASEPKSGQRFVSGGSGVIIDARQGYVVTVNHVIEHADKISVTLADKRQLDASLIGSDPQTDIAVLKIDPDRLVSLPLGDSKTLQVGDYAIALGNPFGVGQTATFGIISGLGRTGFGIEPYEDFIQTDASINPGNSGGALVDTTGHLIGINVALLSKDGGNVGIGFAIPVDAVSLITQQLIATGKVSRGALGLVVQDLPPSATGNVDIKTASGVLVSEVNPESAAAKAGIENGDVVVELDGETITTGGQFRNAMGLKQPGQMVKLKIFHRGSPRNVMAMLESPASP
jgi:S1-C subfamily serine protease